MGTVRAHQVAPHFPLSEASLRGPLSEAALKHLQTPCRAGQTCVPRPESAQSGSTPGLQPGVAEHRARSVSGRVHGSIGGRANGWGWGGWTGEGQAGERMQAQRHRAAPSTSIPSGWPHSSACAATAAAGGGPQPRSSGGAAPQPAPPAQRSSALTLLAVAVRVAAQPSAGDQHLVAVQQQAEAIAAGGAAGRGEGPPECQATASMIPAAGRPALSPSSHARANHATQHPPSPLDQAWLTRSQTWRHLPLRWVRRHPGRLG